VEHEAEDEEEVVFGRGMEWTRTMEAPSQGVAWYRCDTVVSSITILPFSSGLRSHLFFRVLRGHIPSGRLVRRKPRCFPPYIWIRISEHSSLSATSFSRDGPLCTLFFRPFRSRFSCRAINTHNSQSSRCKLFEVRRRCREVFVAAGTASCWLGIEVGVDYDSRPLRRRE
jgi:hypothetical protein